MKFYQQTVKKHTQERYKYVFWTDEKIAKFIATEFPQYNDLFNSLKPKIKQIDMAKYLIVYRYGGFYLDMDVEMFKDPTFLIRDSAVVLCDPAAFYSEANHPFWLDVMQHIEKYKDLFVIQATGPGCLDAVFRRTNYADVVYVPQSVFLPLEHEPFSWSFWQKSNDHDHGKCLQKYGQTSVGCHHGSGSWIESYWYMIAIAVVFVLLLAAISCFAAHRKWQLAMNSS